MSLVSPTRWSASGDVGTQTRANQSVFQNVLDSMVEIQQTLPTHFTPASLTCSRIDRVFTSTPGWILTSVCASASLLAQPRELHDEGIDDHAPVAASLTLRRSLPKDQQPIPRFVIESTHFKKRHDELVERADLASLPPVQRWERHKIILRQAGKFARNALLLAPGNSEHEANQSLSTIARTVWHNDTRLGRKLMQCSEAARRHLVVTDAEVQLRSPAAFKKCVEDAKVAFFSKAKERIDTDYPEATSRYRSSVKQAVRRLAKLWEPTDKRLILAAVKLPSSSDNFVVDRRPERRIAALASGWAPTFAVNLFFLNKARTFCEIWCVPGA